MVSPSNRKNISATYTVHFYEREKMVRAAGLEPARPLWTQDFKSCASTIPPSSQMVMSPSSTKLTLRKLKISKKAIFFYFYP